MLEEDSQLYEINSFFKDKNSINIKFPLKSAEIKINSQLPNDEYEEIAISIDSPIKILDNKDKSATMKIYRKSTTLIIDKSIINDNKTINNLISYDEMFDKKSLKLSLSKSEFDIELAQFIDCLEYLKNSNYQINLNQSNMIPLLYSSTILNIANLQKSVLEKIMNSLEDCNIIKFIKFVSLVNKNMSILENNELLYRKDQIFFVQNLNKYVYWLINYIVIRVCNVSLIGNHNQIELELNCNNSSNIFRNKFSNIIKTSDLFKKTFLFDEYHIIYKNSKNTEVLHKALMGNNYFCELSNVKVNLQFLSNFLTQIKKINVKYYIENNFFNTGKVYRKKNNDGIIDDYPHYYQMVLDNDTELKLYAIRASENSNFILSKNINNFNKFCEDYVGEIVCNFWGTSFDIYDNGIDSTVVNLPNNLFDNRKLLGSIIYDTNIMGECPRYFRSEIINFSNDSKRELKNLEPEWNLRLNCYCLNFYGRVKKASARNFQMICADEPDDILLQHGKENSNEFNIDFRDPFNYITAFAHSLVSIGSKRVVS